MLKVRRVFRSLFGLPIRGQKTRSNAKTARKYSPPELNASFRPLRVSKNSLGRIWGKQERAKRIKSKLRPAAKRVKSSTKKKPVIRSRDTKKSVWR